MNSAIKFLSILLSLTVFSCDSLEETGENPDYSVELSGTYLVDYSCAACAEGQVILSLSKNAYNEVFITPPVTVDHPGIVANITMLSGGDLGLGISGQGSGDYRIYGDARNNGVDGMFTDDDSTLVYTVIYELKGEYDTVRVTGHPISVN